MWVCLNRNAVTRGQGLVLPWCDHRCYTLRRHSTLREDGDVFHEGSQKECSKCLELLPARDREEKTWDLSEIPDYLKVNVVETLWCYIDIFLLLY